MRRLFIFLLCIVVLAGVAAGACLLAYQRYVGPGPAVQGATIIVPPGAGVRTIATQLDQAGLIADRYTFLLGIRVTQADGTLKAGEYAIPARASMAAIVNLLRSGKVVLHRLTVPEGLTSAEIVGLVQAADALAGPSGPVPPEGALLPETYSFARGMRRDALIAQMAAAQDAALDRLWPQRAPDLPLSRQQAVILASIVEKETAVPAERARVAGVFLNRLGRNMRLESDPTVAYGLTRGKAPLGRLLTSADLAAPDPYNTYRNAGLPPTPIANPGLASLRAVLHPAATDSLFFVADGTGGHAFARTLDEHRANVARWRRLNAAPRTGGAPSK